MQEVKVFVVIVTYNGEVWIEKCLQSLALSETPVSVIIVDNCSTDGTTAIIKAQFPEYTLVDSARNLGFGKANNIGITYALDMGADFVFLLNQDAWIEPDTLGVLLTGIRTRKGIGVISPIHLNGKGDKLDANFLAYMHEERTPGFLSDAVLGKLADFYETSFVNAAAWLVSRECLMKVGGFDPVFPHYGEDDDYLKRVIYHGFRVGIARCYIYHDRIVTRTIKGKDPNELNAKKLHIINLLILKNLNKAYYLNVYSFLRRNFNKSVYYFLDGKFKEIYYLFLASAKTVKMLSKAQKSHSLSRDNSRPAFLKY